MVQLAELSREDSRTWSNTWKQCTKTNQHNELVEVKGYLTVVNYIFLPLLFNVFSKTSPTDKSLAYGMKTTTVVTNTIDDNKAEMHMESLHMEPVQRKQF